MNRSFKLTLLYVVLYPWYKGGLASGYGTFFFIGIGSIILIDNFTGKKNLISNKIHLFTFLSLLILLISYFNPRYRTLNDNDLLKSNFHKVIVNTGNINQSKYLADSIKYILDTSKTNPSTSLAIFFHFKKSFSDKYLGSNSENIKDFLKKCESAISLKYIKFLPSSAIKCPQVLLGSIFFVFNFYIFIFVFNSIVNEESLMLFLKTIFFNSLILCIIGFVQKYYHQWDDDYLEILGFWDAPEPRYYFSTFTYKNHWSCYALTSIFIGILLLYSSFIKNNIRLDKNVFLIVTIFSISLLFISIIISGSRSGLLLSIIGIFLILLKLFPVSKLLRINYLLIAIFSLLFLVTPLIVFVLFSKQTQEMRSNTLSLLYDLQSGKKPLRFYLWKDSIEHIRDRHWFGHGYSAYKSTNPNYQSKIVRMERAKSLENAHQKHVPLVAHAHSDILEFFIEFGFFGTFILFFPVILLLSKILLSIKTDQIYILLVGLLTVFAYFLIDFPSRTPATLATVSAFLGLSTRFADLHNKFTE